MTDQDRIDTLTANAITDLYREDGEVDTWQALADIVATEEVVQQVMDAALMWLQNPRDRDDLRDTGWDALITALRDSASPMVERLLDEEAARGEPMEKWEYQESEKLEEWRDRQDGGEM